MSSRSVIAGIALAIASVAPLAGVAHAQDLDCRDFRFQEDAQAVFDQDTSDPNRLDEDQGPDDGIACEALPRRGMETVSPVSPSATAAQPVNPSATPLQSAAPALPVPAVPSHGTRAGIGGAFRPSGLSMGVGLTLCVGAAVAGGYLAARRLRRAG